MMVKGITQRILNLALSIVPHKRGKRIWNSARTIRSFKKTWYENPARLKVYELIGAAYKLGTKLIDCGCGPGFDAERILARFKDIDYTGIDASEQMIERCKKKLGHFPNAKFEKGDIFNLKFEDQSFDIVISCNVLVHVPNFVAALKELCRICGRYLILQFNYINENGYLQDLQAEEFDKRFLDKKLGMYFVYYNPQEIVELCSNWGFRKVFQGNFFLDKYNREAAVLQFVRVETER